MIAYYKNDSGEWVTIASAESSDITVNSPRFTKAGGESVNVTEALENIDQKITRVTKNLAWIYQNGAIGGGGGGGSSDQPEFDLINPGIITSAGNKYLFVSDTTAKVSFQVKANRKNVKFTVSVIYNGSQNYMKDQVIDANQIYEIELTNIDKNERNYLQFTGFDAEGFSIEPEILYVDAGSLSLTSDKPDASYPIFLGEDLSMTFRIKNAIIGQKATLVVRSNNIADWEYQESRGGDWEITLDLKRDLNNGEALKVGSTYVVTAYVTTTAGTVPVKTETLTFPVIVQDSKTLIITAKGISDDIDDTDPKLTEILVGNPLVFSYLISSARYEVFRAAFKIYNADRPVIEVGNWENYTDPSNATAYKNKSAYFSYSSLGLSPGITTIHIKVWASNGEQETIKIVKCRMLASDFNMYPDSNPGNKMYATFNVFTDRTVHATSSVWNSLIKDYTPLEVGGETTVSTNMNVIDTNGVTSGFIRAQKDLKKPPALRLSGGAYAEIDVTPFPASDLGMSYSGNWFRGGGFGLSFTFKSDQHPSANGTIMSLASYTLQGVLGSGITITLEEVTVRLLIDNELKTIITKIAQNQVTTVDIVYTTKVIKILVNGVLSAAMAAEGNIYCLNNAKIILGARDRYNDGKTIDQSCDVDIYNVKLYRTSLNDYDIMRNYINSSAYTHLNSSGGIDEVANKKLRTENFFEDKEGFPCGLWGGDGYKDASLYDYLINSSGTPIPTILIEEPVPSSEFYSFYNQTHTTEQASAVLDTLFPCRMEIKDEKNNTEVVEDMFVSLQGTSSLSYAAKNLELYFGEMPNKQPRLFQPIDNWLPENQFTLKADVVDSAHANNTAIGKFVNESGVMGNTPPMQDELNPYREKVKHTLEGFPVLLFVKFAGQSKKTFLGMYNFNLGRGSFFNLGFKVLNSFSTDVGNVPKSAPALVSAYEESENHYKDNVFSYEFKENQNEYGSFQQDHDSVINYVASRKYPLGNTNVEAGFRSFKKIFSLLATSFDEGSSVQKVEYSLQDKSFKPLEGQVYPYRKATLEEFMLNVNWYNANAYFLICSIFGMVDSLGKNMTMRTWDTTKEWYTAFYDMDTALGLNNNGLETVGITSYIHTYENSDVQDAATRIIENKNDPNGHFDTYNSRLWNVLLDLETYNPGDVADVGIHFKSMWRQWRTTGGIFQNVDKFVDQYYRNYTDGVGAMIFNYDYQIKYLSKYVDQAAGIEGYNSIRFLHGNRVIYVKDWLKKRMWYLDGVFKLGESNAVDSVGGDYLSAPYTNIISNRARGSAGGNVFNFNIETDAPQFFKFTVNDTTNYSLLAANELTPVKTMRFSGSNTPISMNIANRITQMENFKSMNFETLNQLGMPNLMYLDLEGMVTLAKEDSVEFDRLKELREINMRGVRVENRKMSNIALNLSNCDKIKKINVENSDVSSITLPGGGSSTSLAGGNLTELIVKGSKINSLDLQGQPFLTELDLTNCAYLDFVEITNCPKIKKIVISNSGITRIKLSNCPGIEILECPQNINLHSVVADSCPGLKIVNVNGCSNNRLSVNLIGANNLVSCDMGYTRTTSPLLLAKGTPEAFGEYPELGIFKTLTTLNIGNSSINSIEYAEKPVEEVDGVKVLDLSPLENLTSFIGNYNTGVEYYKFGNINGNPVNINGGESFRSSPKLKRVFGNINLASGDTFFYDCPLFRLTNGNTALPTVSTPKTTFWETTVANKGLVTNLSISTKSLTNAFYNTDITTFDMYYIMNRMEGVTAASSLFYNCANIKTTRTDPLKRDTFKECGSLVNATSFFRGCSGMAGPLYSPTKRVDDDGKTIITAYNGLMSPLKSLTIVSHMFLGDFDSVDSYFFYKPSASEYLEINTITYAFNNSIKSVVTTDVASPTPGYIDSSVWLANLPKLINLHYAFSGNSGLNIDFKVAEAKTITGKDAPTTLMFHRNPHLSNLNRAFNGCRGRGQITGNLLGGMVNVINYEGEDFINSFPTKITTMYHAFNGVSGVECVMDDFNDLFAQNRNVVDLSYCFHGTNKGGTVFPSTIFKGLDKLQYVDGFFYNAVFSLNEAPKLPGAMFMGCKSLISIESLFRGLDMPATLTSNSFIDCNLRDVSHSFSYMKGVTGHIPYKLFNMEYDITFTHDIPLADGTKTFVRRATRKSINNYSNAFYATRSLRDSYITFNGNDTETTVEDPGDWITINHDYDPRETFVNEFYDPNTVGSPERVANPNYDPRTHLWDTWSVDGSKIDFIDTHPLVVKYGPHPDEFEKDNTNPFPTRYMCPMDFFRNAVNAPATIVTAAFAAMCTDGSGTGEDERSGIDGRVPPLLFRPIDKITRIDSLFSGHWRLKPYTIDHTQYSDGVGLDVRGAMFYKYQFQGMRNLVSLSDTFSNIRVPADTALPQELLAQLRGLGIVEGLFVHAIFTTNDQIPPNFLAGNPNLTDVSFMFASSRSDGTSSWMGRGPRFLPPGLLSSSSHPNLTNVEGFIKNCTKTTGNSIAFWDFPTAYKIRSTRGCYRECKVLDDYSRIPAAYI